MDNIPELLYHSAFQKSIESHVKRFFRAGFVKLGFPPGAEEAACGKCAAIKPMTGPQNGPVIGIYAKRGLILESVSKFGKMHFRHLILHFCVDSP